MNIEKQTDEKDGQESEKQFLTLADKKPSVIRTSGMQSVSARTISTRELSDNLQRTRDGMINLMRKKHVTDGLERIGGSDGEDETNNFENFGMPVRRKPKRNGKSTRNGGIDGSLDDITNGKKNRGQLREFGSEEFSDGDPNDQSLFKTKNSQQEKHNLGSIMSSNEYLKRSGRGQFFNNENDKRLKSQNPKKDGPLSTRIFIDAFLPSLEGNRIFPLFNYRCSEKIERTNKDFRERNSKLLKKQLVAVSSTDAKKEDYTVKSTIVQQIQKDGELQHAEKILKVKEYRRDEEGIKIVDQAQNIEAFQEQEKVAKLQEIRHNIESQEVDRRPEEGLLQTKNIGRTDAVDNKAEGKEIRHKSESQEVVQVHDLQQIEELHTVKEIQEVSVLQNVNGIDRRPEQGLPQTKSIGRTDAVDDKAKLTEGNDKATEHLKLKSGPSTEEESLLLKLLRILKENEDLVDFLCEKVISKIAARNDFCGPSCKGICGGLNNPSKAE